MSSLDFKYSKTTKGKKNLIICNYSYYIKKENEDSIRYVCKEIGCTASITIENNTNTILYIWKFIIKIKSEETCTTLDFNRINNGSFKTRRRNKEALMRDLELSKLKCRFLEKEFEIMQYLLLLSNLVHDYSK